jgi:hypothetical protein
MRWDILMTKHFGTCSGSSRVCRRWSIDEDIIKRRREFGLGIRTQGTFGEESL